jgi:hypothetical protein
MADYLQIRMRAVAPANCTVRNTNKGAIQLAKRTFIIVPLVSINLTATRPPQKSYRRYTVMLRDEIHE